MTLPLVTALVAASFFFASAREFQSAKGSAMQAELVGVWKDLVVIQPDAGEHLLKFPLSALSSADQNYVREQVTTGAVPRLPQKGTASWLAQNPHKQGSQPYVDHALRFWMLALLDKFEPANPDWLTSDDHYALTTTAQNKRNAIDEIARLGTTTETSISRAIVPLLDIFNDAEESWATRVAVLRALRKVQDPRITTSLADCLAVPMPSLAGDDPSRFDKVRTWRQLRMEVIESLESSQDLKSTEILVQCADETDADVAFRVSKALVLKERFHEAARAFRHSLPATSHLLEFAYDKPFKSEDYLQLLLTLRTKVTIEPESEREQIYLYSCHFSDAPEMLSKNWEVTRRILVEDLASEQMRVVYHAVSMLMLLGREEVVPDLLKCLEAKGASVANVFVNSGHRQLKNAAESWASKNGYAFIPIQTRDSSITWGKR